LRLGGAKQRSLLAILLLHAGETVSGDRLVDELWDDAPPEDAATALQQHVSRLRKLLEPHAVVVTRPPGYAIELADDQLDLRRFERLRDDGRRLVDDGRPAEAAEALGGALALWRGRPLADLENERFAGEAIQRLDEAWIEAVELRVEADLALGRHAALVAELRTLVRRHPLREQLRGQLMLALYRAGRQAEALEAYSHARRTLADELGLEPGPELRRLQQAILDQDPSLELPRTRGRARTRPPRRRALLAAGAALLAGAVAAAALMLTEDESPSSASPAAGGELVAIDAASGRIERRLPAGRTPAWVAAGDERLWVVDADARTLLAVDPSNGELETLATGATPTEVAVGAGAVWVVNSRPISTSQFAGPVPTQVLRLDPVTRTQRATVELPAPRGAVSNAVGNRLAVSESAAWAVTASGAVVRLDAETATITRTAGNLGALAIAAGPAGVWALRRDGAVVQLDEGTGRVRLRARLPTEAPTAISVGETAAWVSSSTDGTLWRIGPEGEVGAVEVGSGAAAIAAGARRTWVANPLAGTVTAVDPGTMRVTKTVPLGGIPRSISIRGDTVWAAVDGEARAQVRRARGINPMPASICEPVVGGSGSADLLLVSDLPLQGGIRITATQMAQAITFALRERGFRAGRFRVAYQSCDDSVARTGLFDEAKCAANARAYGTNPAVRAVIGTLNSPCALAAVPELNRARGGPLAMVSPLNSFVGLTREAPGVPPALLASLYPTGRRNYLRVFPTDDLQGAALALLARDRGKRRVYVLDDGEPDYGKLMATGFATAARRLGLQIVGRASWDPGARSYAALARRAAAARPDAVFFGGVLDTNAAGVVRAVRGVAPDADVLAPDGLTPLLFFARDAGPAAQGAFVSLAGVVTERLPRAGSEFVRRFARTQAGAVIEPSAVYAAQAAQVVMLAVARSDGTRAGILDELFRTRVRGGLLGSFSFDARGDITESPVTILRVDEGPGGRAVESVEGGVVERVVRPSPSLVAPG
jgi:branched-chain amino acid transport system substrate-binding protein